MESMETAYTIKMDAFEGPLPLLLDMVEKRKLFINDISLARVADDYVTHVKGMGQLPVATTANFILIASVLVLIKSKSLLPTLSLTEEEQGDVVELERRLVDYQRVRELSVHVGEQFGKAVIFGRKKSGIKDVVFSPHEGITVASVSESIRDMIHHLPKEEPVVEVPLKKVVSLEEMIDGLRNRIQKSLTMSFKDFSGLGKKERVEVVVGFLALLELVKEGIVAVRQQGNFEDIEMEGTKVGVPSYE